MNPIRICGGGLAGLSLGIALRQTDVPVTLIEAGNYPRHRVCGEFISGAGQKTLESLGLGSILAGAIPNHDTAWFIGDDLAFSERLPAPAMGLSRYLLDQRLASKFEDMGGKLTTGVAVREPSPDPGTIWACGRTGSSRKWLALKLHCRGFSQTHDLTMHLGTGGYIGISRIEGGKVNACGLFNIRRDLSPGKKEIMIAYLRANGLNQLAKQLSAAEIDPDSITATTMLNFTATSWPDGIVCVGDSNTAIPPFAGNGMSMALESAQTAFPHLLSYAEGKQHWSAVRDALRRSLRKRFRVRLATARLLHPILLQSRGRQPLSWAFSHGILPFNLFYRLLR